MKPEKKPRADAILKNLPEDRQREIFTRLTVKTPEWPDTSFTAVRRWLAEDGVKTSETALHLFYSWYLLHAGFKEDEETTETLLELLKKEVPGLTQEQIDGYGQRTFSLMALRRQDQKAFIAIRSARAKGELERAKLELRKQAEARLARQAELEHEKFQIVVCEKFLAWFKDQQAQDIANSTASNAEKIARLRQTYFKSVDDLEQSGEVKLPA